MEKFKIPKSFLMLLWNGGPDALVSWMQNSLMVSWAVWYHLPSLVEVGRKSVFTVREHIPGQSVDMKSMSLRQQRKQEKKPVFYVVIQLNVAVGLCTWAHVCGPGQLPPQQTKTIYHLLGAHSVPRMLWGTRATFSVIFTNTLWQRLYYHHLT